jgi:hypothetical protein
MKLQPTTTQKHDDYQVLTQTTIYCHETKNGSMLNPRSAMNLTTHMERSREFSYSCKKKTTNKEIVHSQ